MTSKRSWLWFFTAMALAFHGGGIAADKETTTNPTPAPESASPADESSKKVVTTPEEEAKPKELGLIVREIEIQFAGPRTVSDSVILAKLRTKVGEPFTQTQSDDDVRSLYSSGLFSNVRILQERAADGLKVVVHVQGKAKLKEVVFEGNVRYKDDRLRKEAKYKTGHKKKSLVGDQEEEETVQLKPGDTLSERQVAEAANSLIEFYQKGGYPNVKISFDVTPDELTGQSVVKFIIAEGQHAKIARVDFEGNKAFETRILRKKTTTRNHNWLSWLTKKGFLKETDIDEDKGKLVDFYRSEGYIDAEVKDVKFDYPQPEEIVVTFFLYEGNQYKVGQFKVGGNQLFTTEEIEKKLTMKADDLFTPGGLQKDIKAIQDLYGARGYVDTSVKPTRVPNVRTGTMDVSLDIREGDLAYIDLIEVRGNIKTKDKVIRRELAVAPGEIYNTVKIDASKKRLENLGYFSSVTAQPENTEVSNRKNLVISVEEQRTGSISFGAGFSSVDSILGFVEVTQGNFDIAKPPYFTGAGQKARIRAQFGARRQDYIVSFTEPWFLNKRLSAGFDLFYNEASYLSSLYNERRYGFDLRLGKALGEFNKAELMYKLEQIELFDVSSTAHQSILMEKGTRTKSSVTGNLARDTRDSLILPSKGYKTELWGEVAGGPALGGQTDIYKIGFNGQIYFTMPWWEKNILAFNGATAVVEEWDDGTRVPIFDKFFLGGPNSVRGFRFRDVGPKDPQGGEPLGGKTMAYLQTEYSIPVIDRVRFATFIDAGQVWERSYDWGATSPNIGAGIGLRLNLPIGPINLDYGWPIRHDSFTGDDGQFSFNVGTKF
ncbi:MAG: outer membrane protein assembly factor BamA [Verrucomicrobia bacterium]|nr:outer membrane protein assembly factor BamA [Verrucomicrobiota bacterium]